MRALLDDGSFWVAGGVTVLLVLGSRQMNRRLGVGIGDGLAVAMAALAGLGDASRLTVPLVGALALLALGARLAASSSGWFRLLASVPGATVLGLAVGSSAPTWMRVAAAGSTILVVPLAGSSDRDRPRVTGLLFAASALGVYATVPDTEHARVLVAAALLGAVFGSTRQAVDPVGTTTLVGLLMWTTVSGGYPRPGAVVGALACVGMLALAPLARTWALPTLLVVASHAVLVVMASRLAGLRQEGLTALVLAGGSYAVVIAALAAIRNVRPHARALLDPQARSAERIRPRSPGWRAPCRWRRRSRPR